MMKRILLIILIVLLTIPVGLLGLMNSVTGSRWLLQTVFSNLPVQVSVKTIDGRLLERIVLSDLHYKSDTETVTVKNLVFAWQPSELFSGILKIVDMSLNDVNVSVTKTAAPEQSTFDFNAELRLPVQIVLENLLLTNLTFQQGEQLQQLEKLHLAAFTEHDRVNLVSLDVNAKPLEATVKGQVGLGKGFPLSLTADWQATTEEYGLWQATITVTGDIRQLAFDNQLSSPFKSALTGNLDNLQDAPRINVRGDWQNLNWPLGGNKPQVSSEQGSLEVDGLLSDYRIMLNAQLSPQYLSKSRLTFKGQGSTEALSIKELELKSPEGVFQIDGDVSWKDATVFDLTATGQNFNPAILLPELPGSLNFNTRIKGKLAGEALQLDAEINKLSGKLRGYPVSAGGKLALAGDQLKVDALQVVSGRNKIAVNGTLGQEQAALIVAIDAPALESLWPKLGGSLKGDGRLQGAWKNPSVAFQASGKRLRFAEHSAEQLTVNIDYQADAKLTSKMQLSVNAIKTGELHIAKLLIDGLGTLEQHRFKADINSSYGDLSSMLTGSFKAGVWQGDFSRLDLNTKDSGRWQLTHNMTVRVAQSPAGVDVSLAQACLAQQAADLCVQGQYPASGDFQFKINANALPTGLMQVYLPESMQLKGIINADAELRQQQGLLSGNFRLTMPANAKIVLQTQQGPIEFILGSWLLSGKLKETMVSADFDLALTGRDYLRGQVQLDTGQGKALAGQITGSMLNFAWLNPFVPQLSNIKGDLKANLALQGRTDQPAVSGAVRFTGGAVDFAELGLGIRDIRLEALPSAYAERIQLHGSAKSGQGFIQLDGFANLQGNGELMLNGTNFEVAKLPEAQITVSPELKGTFTDRQRKVTGKLKIPKAIIQMTQIPENAVKVSPDEVILGEQQAEQKAAAAVPVDADIDIELGKQVNFSGQGLKTDLSGTLKVTKTGETTAVHGNINMDKARYKSYGQDLTVRKGQILFNGPIDKPWLDVEAIRVSKSKDVTAILSLTGPLDAPKTHLYSEPALPEEEVLAYLITGGPLNQVSQAEGNMVASAALSYGAGKASWLANKLGVGELEVEQGETLEDTMATVGQYLTPDLYVGTKVGLFNQQVVLVLKRKLTKTLNVETQTGTSQRIKLNYEKDSH
ncbi:MAG: translocation/assembly module TamB domain-containing protein [Methylobacter sp.]|uniref:translocation/assembly module TamB domain-containing protein n=1 Tax=Methylobacter sp. TaxID=2051955 RepID=UPI00272F2F23|nr:translocation/assembly module TamB domain-containing protein [Methylobacter sp.]MDP1666554.1 translocation/assembly module TamB domain-containing protein [Methylobacter sp.]